MKGSSYHLLGRKLARLAPTSGLGRFTLYLLLVDLFIYGLSRLRSGRSGAGALDVWVVLLTSALIVLGFILGLRWFRRRFMWRLRNRLIVTYTFIGVIPLMLVLMMALIAGYLFAGQFATFLASSDLNSELRTLEAANSAMATELATVARVHGAPTSKDLLASQEFRPDEHMKTAEVVAWYRGQRIELYAPGGRSVGELPAWLKDDFQGIVRDDARLYLRAINTVSANGATLTVLSSMPVDGALLERIAGDIGEVTIYPGRRIRSRAIGDRAPELSADSGDQPREEARARRDLGRLAATPEPAPRPRSHFLRPAGDRRLENRGDGAHPVACDDPFVAAVRAAVSDHGGIRRRHLDAAHRSGHCFRNN